MGVRLGRVTYVIDMDKEGVWVGTYMMGMDGRGGGKAVHSRYGYGW